jgi:hypothetical protein
MKITELTEREMHGITYQAGRDAAPNMDPVVWFTSRAAYDAEVMARNADADEPRRMAEDIAALPPEDREQIKNAIDAVRPVRPPPEEPRPPATPPEPTTLPAAAPSLPTHPAP